MNLNNQRVLIMGIGVSGIATIRSLAKLGAKISINDLKDEEELKDVLEEIKDIDVKKYLGNTRIDLSQIDLIIKSPGIPPNNSILLEAKKKNIKIINDIELGSEFSNSKNIIAITGTNGKTTSTILLGEILRTGNHDVFIGGNIGKSIIEEMFKGQEDDIFILETSSFQLENTINFKPKISLVLNIKSDHLDWHGSLENYINAKKKIFQNQDSNDYTVLNYDDRLLRSFEKEIKSNIVYFSIEDKLDRGVYIDGGNIHINIQGENINLISLDRLLLKGRHNLENILGSVAVAYLMGVNIDNIRNRLLKFKGVEHRLEFVVEKSGRKFYNDSKGTNIDSSIRALEAIEAPIILIAGGYDKKIEFKDFIRAFQGKVNALILLGQTALKIKETAEESGFTRSFLVSDMEEAVDLAYSLSQRGDNILLSPACASWGMFKNFEERGKVFKEAIDRLEEK